MPRMSRQLRQKLQGTIRKNRRETIYRMMSQRYGGIVPCFVCGRHVVESKATLEHILALSRGGTDDMDNLSISHEYCNKLRGDGDFDGDLEAKERFEKLKQQHHP